MIFLKIYGVYGLSAIKADSIVAICPHGGLCKVHLLGGHVLKAESSMVEIAALIEKAKVKP